MSLGGREFRSLLCYHLGQLLCTWIIGVLKKKSQSKSTFPITASWRSGHNLHAGYPLSHDTTTDVNLKAKEVLARLFAVNLLFFPLDFGSVILSLFRSRQIYNNLEKNKERTTREKKRQPRKNTVHVVKKDKRISEKRGGSTTPKMPPEVK